MEPSKNEKEQKETNETVHQKPKGDGGEKQKETNETIHWKPGGKTEDRSELSRGPKGKQKVGWNHPTDMRKMEVTDKTVHRKPRRKGENRRRPMKPFIGNPRGKQKTGQNCPGGNKKEAGSLGDERKRWVGFQRKLAAGAILGRPTC